MPCNGAAKADCTGSKTALFCRAVNSLPGLLLAGLVLFGFGGHTLFLGVGVLATGAVLPEDAVHDVYNIVYYTFLGLNVRLCTIHLASVDPLFLAPTPPQPYPPTLCPHLRRRPTRVFLLSCVAAPYA